MDFGKEQGFPSTTKGIMRLLLAYEKEHGEKEMPINLGPHAFVYLRNDQIATTLTCHGPEVEY